MPALAKTAQSHRSGLDLLCRRLQGVSALTTEDYELVRSFSDGPTKAHRTGQVLAPGQMILVSGWACRARLLGGGLRQVLGFVLPGDLIDFGARNEAPLYETVALSRGAVMDVTRLFQHLGAANPDHDRLRRAIAQLDHAERVRHVDHTVRLGALGAYEALAHLLLELQGRSAAVGLLTGDRFPILVSQEVLGGSIGLSGVHTNRVLNKLKADGLIDFGAGWAAALNPQRLAETASGAKAASGGRPRAKDGMAA